MKKLWIASLVAVASTSALAQSVIYKHVDASGRITYSNKPMKDATVVELEPLTTIPATPAGMLQPQPSTPAATAKPAAATSAPATATVSPVKNAESSDAAKPELKPAVAIVTALPSQGPAAFPKIDNSVQRKRDEERRKILAEELEREEELLATVRKSLVAEQQNPDLIAAVRLVQNTAEPSPTQQLDLRQKLDKASGRIRGLQATAAEHEKNIEALKKELGAIKP
jgi:hypothetical protein